MIKRLFYRLEHADGDGAADSSSSDSDSELEGHATEAESEDDDDVAVEELNQNDGACSNSSGYESEESSADEINVDSSSVLYEKDDESENDKEIFFDSPLSSKRDNALTKVNSRADGSPLSNKRGNDVTKSNSGAERSSLSSEVPDCILQIKSVFRCRICPRILCLTEETMRAHINSKRHARSEKLMKENRLKSILNSDGQIENQETAAELHARIVALVQDKGKKKNNKQQQRRNMSGKKEKVFEASDMKKSREKTCKPAKKKRKSEN